ncbi:NADH dehydrogenase (ubiquinone) complex I, assembly factor 6 [Seminavis robusta]|uniref:NADH dehydrogenase (Ubiquinone) complex I, assembly factor 6 n=1 Tax=Seminavis robusta TaxID=568900 RepID=A0A9N8DAU3_9STRA|nr:NADH dehydrogenase (ubiquinone) complex I, assembly factor 6 [Seminavis robusta]|eukprot:Sro68_g038350.1 NADH dehydrogenase (ubiquinone) complex I, assembly factor 6 (1014) ;mRNA; r:125951-128992
MANSDFTWYWDNDGVWTPYGDEHQAIIESARLSGDPQAHLPIGNSVYLIDFHESVQESPVGNRRRISRRANGNNNVMVAASENTLWFWRDDDGMKPYDTAMSQRLTQARLEGDVEVYLEIRETLYQLDLARNLQINMHTNFARDIGEKELYHRVVFLGAQSCTRIAHHLVQNNNPSVRNDDAASPDVNINTWSPPTQPSLNLQVWDFVGREALYSYQSIFFTPQTLFVIAWCLDETSDLGTNGSKQPDDQALDRNIRDRVQFWIDVIEERVPSAAAILPIACMTDKSSSLPEPEIRRRCKRLQGQLKSRRSSIQFCDDPDNPVVRVSLSSDLSNVVGGMDMLQEIMLASLIEHAMPLSQVDVTLRETIRTRKMSGVKIVDTASLNADDAALTQMAHSGEILYIPSLPHPFSGWIVLDLPWFYRLSGSTLRRNWQALVGDGRRRQGRGDPPSFAGATPENCPVLHEDDGNMLLQSSLDASDYSPELHGELGGGNLLRFVTAVLVHFAVIVPVDVDAENPSATGQRDGKVLTTSPAYMPLIGITNPNTCFINAGLYFVPCLLEDSVRGDSNLADYRNATGSTNTFVAQKVQFQDGVPKSMMHTIISNLLRDILRATRGNAVSVKMVYCWCSILRIKFSMTTNDGQQVALDVCSQVVEPQQGGNQVTSYLCTNAHVVKGDGARYIWQAGYGLVCKTIQNAMIGYRDLAYSREAFCHECLISDGIHGAPSWKWAELENALKDEKMPSLRCPAGHTILESLSEKQELNQRRAVVLIGLYDPSKRKGRIQRLGSGIVVDAAKGLIVTAARNVMMIEGSERFGQNYDGILGAKVVVGVLPENGGEAVFRFFAKIRATDPALSASNVCHVDACVLKISSKFENDVRGNGDKCADEIEIVGRRAVQGLVQIPNETKWEVEDPVRIYGYEQEEGAYINRGLSEVCGPIVQYREEEPRAGQPHTFQPLKTVVVRAAANPGFLGGPCINEEGKLIGILSCADPDEKSRSCVVPLQEWLPLVRSVP